MSKSLAFYIGTRYTRAKRRNGFISFISLASMLGIALGVTVLITALSVMNGFNNEIKTRFFAMVPQITVMAPTNIQSNWQSIAKRISTLPGISGIAPFVSGKGMIVKNDNVFGVETVGILPSQEGKVSKLPEKMIAGNLKSLQPNKFNIILGQTLAESLGVGIGDTINLYTPQINFNPAGAFPRYRPFTVSGIFHANDAFGFDLAYAFVNMQDAARVFPAQHGVNGLYVNLHDIYQVGNISGAIGNMYPGFQVSNWTQTQGAFFQAIWMEKTALFVILLLIIAVAAFNLVATLVMVVNDKRADIAILRTLGAMPGTILRTFLVQGLIVGVIGTVIGLACGLLLAYYATDIVNWFQHDVLHMQILQSSVFFVNFLPSKIQASDVIIVSISAVLLSLLAALYPAWLAFRTQPAEALRYE